MNVHVPLHLVLEAASVLPTGTPLVHVGVTGALTHSTPCLTSVGLLSVTAAPAVRVTCGGAQAWVSSL